MTGEVATLNGGRRERSNTDRGGLGVRKKQYTLGGKGRSNACRGWEGKAEERRQ